jgi:hypothetical protein
MGMSKPQPGDHFLDIAPSLVKLEPSSVSSSETSRTSSDDNDIIVFGPIKVKPRKRPAPTLATGRRSKYEVLTPDEEQKRRLRRARNRAAAERVRISRLDIEKQLQEQIEQLEKNEQQLSLDVQQLQNQKLRLETRLFTHERMCSTSRVLSTSDIDLSSYLLLDNGTGPVQLQDKFLDLDFEDAFVDSFIDEQNTGQSFSSLMLTNDLNELFMDV